MKKLYLIILSAALLCGAVSCLSLSPEEPTGAQNTISATLEDGPLSRTSLQSSGKVFWSKNDKITVFPDDQAMPCTYYLQSGEGTSTGTFSGYGVGGRYIAYYPASGEVSRKGENEIGVFFPEEQQYAQGSFADGAAPMAAAGTGSKLTFRNLSSVLKLSVTGRHTVTKVVFRANDKSVKVSGEASVNVSDPSKPELKISENGIDSLYINVGSLLLSESKATDFYLAVPPLTYKGGFTVRIYTTSGYMDKAFTSDFTMERSRVHEATPFAVKLTSGVEPSSSLEGLGTPEKPFRIGSLNDLLLMQLAANSPEGTIRSKSGGSVKASTASYLMTADINLSPACGKSSGLNWAPIGSKDLPFSGNFDGGGHKISGLYIDTPGQDYQGFFGYMPSGKLSNITVEGTINYAEKAYSGLLVGWINGDVDNCCSYGTISNGGSNVGGLVGSAVTVTNCTNYANITTKLYKRHSGGVAGHASSIVGCSNYGTITGDYHTGGICGIVDYLTADCVNEGIVYSCAYPCGGIAAEATGLVVNCVNNGYAEGSYVGGIIGYGVYSAIYNCANYGIVSLNHEFAGGIAAVLGDANFATEMENCISLGSLSNFSQRTNYTYKDVTYYAGLCGWIVGKKSDANIKYDSSAEYSYWLYPTAEGLDIKDPVGVLDGTGSNLLPLTQAQMKGADCGKALYKSSTKIADALNAWVADHPLHSSWGVTLKQWKYDSKTGYPVMK